MFLEIKQTDKSVWLMFEYVCSNCLKQFYMWDTFTERCLKVLVLLNKLNFLILMGGNNMVKGQIWPMGLFLNIYIRGLGVFIEKG